MNLRKLRRIQRERSGRGKTESYRVGGIRWVSDYNFTDVWSRVYVTTGNFWRKGIKSNFQ